jgi:nitronate monooxygenase
MGGEQIKRFLDLTGVELPVIQAPMAGATTTEMVIATSEAGGLGSLPGAMLSIDQMRSALDQIRATTRKPINVNFFTHEPPGANHESHMAWRSRLAGYYVEMGLDPSAPVPSSNRAPFDAEYCAVIESYKPEVVSFDFGLPEPSLLDRVKKMGAKVIASATTVEEARWLEQKTVEAPVVEVDLRRSRRASNHGAFP